MTIPAGHGARPPLTAFAKSGSVPVGRESRQSGERLALPQALQLKKPANEPSGKSGSIQVVIQVAIQPAAQPAQQLAISPIGNHCSEILEVLLW